MADAALCVDAGHEIGESPVWCAAEAALFWVDCTGRRLLRQLPAGGAVTAWPLARMPAAFAFRRDKPGMILAARNGLALFDPATGALAELPTGMVDFAVERFNDGKCDRAGRFWIGTMDRAMRHPVGALYRVDPDRSIHRMQDGVILSNGIAWSPDDRLLYHCDTGAGIFVHDHDPATGAIAHRRPFLEAGAQSSPPDGCTVDAEGFLWVAEPLACRVARYDPAGRMERAIRLPACPSSCCFGGADLATLYITTLRLGVPPGLLARQPHAGALFAARPGVPGLPAALFAA